MEKHLHIVCFDVPYPPDYGGLFDLYYKIVALHKHDIQIHLHCYEYGRGQQSELNKYCVEVKYYPRKTGLQGLSFSMPYIVSSRSDRQLLFNLSRDNYPILLEGIHSTYLLATGKLRERKVFVRLHNVEHEYYKRLKASTNSAFHKFYFLMESRLLKNYEKYIAKRAVIIAVSSDDETFYKTRFLAENIHYLPIFLPWREVFSKPGMGKYCLYHGNLSVPENESAAIWLINNIAGNISLPLVIAGHAPSSRLLKLAASKEVRVVADPVDKDLEGIISEAQINILPSFNNTGVKIKLLHALFAGRHCITNSAGDKGSGVEGLSHHCETAGEFQIMIQKLSGINFEENIITVRQTILESVYNNDRNALDLITLIY